MSQYTQEKFNQLGEERKVRIMLDLIYRIESSWEASEKDRLLLKLRDYFQWFDFYNCSHPLLNHISHLQFNISKEMSLRSLLDIAVPMERYLSLSIKDEAMFKVVEGDLPVAPTEKYPLCFVLDHLRSAFNVGSIFRTAECLGVEHIYLLGYTPTPEDKGVQKTAMGTDQFVSWSQHNHLEDILPQLENHQLVGLETVQGGVSLPEFKAPKALALVVGNERFGINASVIEKLSECVTIPMMGRKNSLNVASALSIFSFEVIRQWTK